MQFSVRDYETGASDFPRLYVCLVNIYNFFFARKTIDFLTYLLQNVNGDFTFTKSQQTNTRNLKNILHAIAPQTMLFRNLTNT